MFDSLAERGSVTPRDDERKTELAVSPAAQQEEFGNTLPQAQELYEADATGFSPSPRS